MLATLVKVRPQNRMAADNNRLPASMSLTSGWHCQLSTCPFVHVPLTVNNVPLT